jgi:hypothetical protein
MNELPATPEKLIKKLKELDKIQEQVARGLITIREALNYRVWVMTQCQAILKEMVAYELGE